MNKLKALNLLPIQHYFQFKKLRLFYRIRKDSIGIDISPVFFDYIYAMIDGIISWCKCHPDNS